MEVSSKELLAFIDKKVAKWWIPDDVVFPEALQVGGTGKFQKNKLRELYHEQCMPFAPPGPHDQDSAFHTTGRQRAAGRRSRD
ncbi:hypothetical protein NRS07_10960 [Massilia sp. H6]|nr:hypothetical protein NRS07_10960 [Massilia sp. H6]